MKRHLNLGLPQPGLVLWQLSRDPSNSSWVCVVWWRLQNANCIRAHNQNRGLGVSYIFKGDPGMTNAGSASIPFKESLKNSRKLSLSAFFLRVSFISSSSLVCFCFFFRKCSDKHCSNENTVCSAHFTRSVWHMLHAQYMYTCLHVHSVEKGSKISKCCN